MTPRTCRRRAQVDGFGCGHGWIHSQGEPWPAKPSAIGKNWRKDGEIFHMIMELTLW